MTGDCESERIWKLIESSRSLQAPAKKKSSLTLLEHISNACADISEKLQDKRFTVPVNVLEQLLGGVVTPSVIIDLLPGHEGYAVSLSNRGAGSHTHQRDHQITLPYEDTELLDYLDAGHIPPVLLELIDRTHCCKLVEGCLVVELRNHRGYHNSSGKFSRHYFLLKPTAESVIAAVNHAVNTHKATDDDGLQLESKILLATQPPLCLDTSTDVTCVANRLQYNKHKFHTHCFKRYLKRRAQAMLTRAHMMQNTPPPKYLRLHQIIPRDRQAASHDVSSRDPTTSISTSVTLALPAAPHELLREVSSRVPVATVAAPVSSVETPKQSTNVTVTTDQVPPLMKNYNEKADQYLVKPTKTPVVPLPIPMPTPMVTRPFPPKVLSPIEKPFVFASPVHPSSGQRINQPLAPRLVPGATPMRPQLVMGGRPITSVTPVRPSKPHSSPPTTAVRKPMPIQAIPSGTSVKAIPIASSPAVNIITPASIMAHLAASKVAIGNPAVPISVTRPVSVSSAAVPISVHVTRQVAISNPVLPMSVTQPVAVSNPALPISFTRSVAISNQAVPISVTPVAISNPSPSQSISNPVSTIPSVAIASLSANRSVMSNIPAGVIPLTKIRPAYQGRLPPILRRRPNQVPPQRPPPQSIQKPATPPPLIVRASSPVPPPRPPPMQKAPTARLTGSHLQSQAQKPPDLPPPPVLPKMPTLRRGALRSSIPTTSTK